LVVRILATVFVAALALVPAARPAQLRPEASFEASLVKQINAVRQARGLRPFTVSAKLAAAATQHSREMGTYGYFEHESPDRSPFWKRIEQWYPSSGWRSWGVAENILYSSPDLSAGYAVSSWMSSPGHRANLLSRSWREIGVAAVHFASAPGTYDDRPVTILTADFGARR
jgi:uncharacterized protein YkwD